MTLYELAKYVDDINTQNGFDKPTWENLPTKVMFVVTELNELASALTSHTKSNSPEELADVAIRLMSLLQSVWGHSWTLPRDGFIISFFSRNGPAEGLWPILNFVCQGVEFWRYNDRVGTEHNLSMALSHVFALAKFWEINLVKEIKKKAEINKKRGYLHYKSRSEG